MSSFEVMLFIMIKASFCPCAGDIAPFNYYAKLITETATVTEANQNTSDLAKMFFDFIKRQNMCIFTQNMCSQYLIFNMSMMR